MRSRAPLFGLVLAVSSPFALACGGAMPDASTAPITTVMLDSGPPADPVATAAPTATGPVATADPPATAADAGAPSTPTASGDFFSCAADADCVAVSKNSCCNNGFMEAVNKTQADAYKASFTCAKKKICPMFRIKDSHVARCSPDTKKCELVRPNGAPTPPGTP